MLSIQSHGENNFQTGPESFDIRARAIHKMEVSWVTPARDTYSIDSAPPDYANMRITNLAVERDGNAWLSRLQCEGILGSETFLELNRVDTCPEDGWDTIDLTIYTREPNAVRWRKGSQIQHDPVTGVTGEADDDLLTKAAHGLTTGQVFYPTFASGFAGLTSGSGYYACVISSSTFKAALNAALAAAGAVSANGTPFAITGTHSTNKINATAHGKSNGTVVTFPTLTGGTGLTAITVPYYIINAGTDDFEVSLTAGGTAVNFTSDISAGTCRTGSTIDITTDGTDMTIAPVVIGLEYCWITDRRTRKADAEGYKELDLQLKGLIQTEGESKPVKRRIGTTAQSVNLERMTKAYTNEAYTGWPATRTSDVSKSLAKDAAQIDQPQISVTDTLISTDPPPTHLVPSHWTPPNAPDINLYSFDTSATKVVKTYHLPWGWKVLNLQSDQIPDKPIYLISITWGYQAPITVADAPFPERAYDSDKWILAAP